MIKPLPEREKYTRLLKDIMDTMENKGRGYGVAQAINDAMWEELGTHKQRMQEQIEKIDLHNDPSAFSQELQNAESIYEASKLYLTKFQPPASDEMLTPPEGLK